MRIEDFMTRDVATCHPADSLVEAAAAMWCRDCGALPVVDPENGKLAGMITDRDICMAAYTKGLPLRQIRVSEVMTKDVVSCRFDDEMATAHETLREHHIRRVPVVDGEHRVVGIVTLNDLALRAAAATGASGRELKGQLADTLGSICRHRELAMA